MKEEKNNPELNESKKQTDQNQQNLSKAVPPKAVWDKKDGAPPKDKS